MNEDEIPGLAELRRRLTDTDAPDTPYEPALSAVHRSVHSYVYRVPGIKTGREHHLLSRLEYFTFLFLDFSKYRNIREQFEIPLELSIYFAEKLEIKHPYDWKKKRRVPVTIDFMLSNPVEGWTAVDVKPSEKMKNKRVLKKFELVAAILERVQIPHTVTTEKDQPPVATANYQILHPLALSFDPPPLPEAEMIRADVALRELLRDATRGIRDAAALCDMDTGLGRGRLTRAALWLIANQRWAVDLTRRVGPDEPVSFLN